MSEKYKVIKSTPLVGKKEINQLKDFDKVLARAEGANKVTPNVTYKYAAIISLLVMVSIGAGIFVFTSENEEENHQPKLVERNTEPVFPAPKGSKLSNELEVKTEVDNKLENDLPKTSKKKITDNFGDEISEPEIEKTNKLKSETGVSTLPKPVKEVEKIVHPNDSQTASEYEEAIPIIGFDSLYRYMAKAIQYPEELKPEKVEGKVVVEFEINEKGVAENIKVVEGLHSQLDEEAKRIIKEMPAWYPAKVYGTPIKSKMRIPLTFQIN